jgi:hypothetical protein
LSFLSGALAGLDRGRDVLLSEFEEGVHERLYSASRPDWQLQACSVSFLKI